MVLKYYPKKSCPKVMNIRIRKRIVKLRRFLKKFLSFLGSVLLSLAVFAAIIFGLYKGGCRVYNHFKEGYYFPVGEHLYCKVYKDGTKSLCLTSSNKKVGKRYKEVDAALYGDSMVHVKNKRDKEGLASATTGKLMVPCKYKVIFSPDEKFNYAACYTRKRELVFVDCNNGKEVFEMKSGADIMTWHEVRFQGNYCIIPMANGKEGLIDSAGQYKFKNCNILLERGKYCVCDPYADGVSSLYDAADLHCLCSDMDQIYITNVGILCLKGQNVCLMDTTATHILTDLLIEMYRSQLELSKIECLSDGMDLHEEIQPNHERVGYRIFSSKGLWGVLDENYNVIIEPLWDNIKYLGDGYFLCYFSDEEYGVIMNKDGEMLRRSKTTKTE